MKSTIIILILSLFTLTAFNQVKLNDPVKIPLKFTDYLGEANGNAHYLSKAYSGPGGLPICTYIKLTPESTSYKELPIFQIDGLNCSLY